MFLIPYAKVPEKLLRWRSLGILLLKRHTDPDFSLKTHGHINYSKAVFKVELCIKWTFCLGCFQDPSDVVEEHTQTLTQTQIYYAFSVAYYCTMIHFYVMMKLCVCVCVCVCLVKEKMNDFCHKINYLKMLPLFGVVWALWEKEKWLTWTLLQYLHFGTFTCTLHTQQTAVASSHVEMLVADEITGTRLTVFHNRWSCSTWMTPEWW